MRAIFAREMLVIGRGRAFAAGVSVHAALLGAFLLAWGNGGRGLPTLAHLDFYAQVRLMQSALLVALLPWAAARSAAAESRDDTVWLSAITAVPPSHLILARAAATWLALAVVVAAGLPMVCLAAQVSLTPIAAMLRDEVALLGLSAIAASAVQASRCTVESRLTGWAVASLATATIWATVRSSVESPILVALLLTIAATTLTAVLTAGAGVSRRYLSEPSS